jgi:hypothetical protein
MGESRFDSSIGLFSVGGFVAGPTKSEISWRDFGTWRGRVRRAGSIDLTPAQAETPEDSSNRSTSTAWAIVRGRGRSSLA